MLSVVKRYITNTSEAEDTLMEGFVKVFSKLDQYQGGGSFEGWIRKIMVNEALMSIRKNKDRYPVDIDAAFDVAHPDETLMQLGLQEIENLISSLPVGREEIKFSISCNPNCIKVSSGCATSKAASMSTG